MLHILQEAGEMFFKMKMVCIMANAGIMFFLYCHGAEFTNNAVRNSILSVQYSTILISFDLIVPISLFNTVSE